MDIISADEMRVMLQDAPEVLAAYEEYKQFKENDNTENYHHYPRL